MSKGLEELDRLIEEARPNEARIRELRAVSKQANERKQAIWERMGFSMDTFPAKNTSGPSRGRSSRKGDGAIRVLAASRSRGPKKARATK